MLLILILPTGGVVNVSSGGQVYDTSANSSGKIKVYNGGTASNVTLTGSGSDLIISTGGVASNVTVNSQSWIGIRGGTLTSGTVYSGGAVQVLNGGSASNITLSNGGTMSVFDGPAFINNTIIDGGMLYCNVASSAGTGIQYGTANTTVTNGGGFNVYNGGYASNTTVTNSGIFTIFSSAIAADVTVTDNGSVTLCYNASASDIKLNNGKIKIYANASAYQTSANNSSLISVYSSGKMYDTTITDHTILTVFSTGIVSNTTVGDYAILSVQNGGSIYDATLNNNGSLTIDSGGSLNGDLYISNGGSANIWASAGGNVYLYGDVNTGLTITGLENGGNVTTVITPVINNFSGVEQGNSDAITLEGIRHEDITSVTYQDASGNDNGDYVTLILENGSKITLNIIGAESSGYALSSSSNGSLVYEVCFLTGTLIRALAGLTIAVEGLRVGDQILTYDWKNKQDVTKTVKWVGHKTVTVNPDKPYDDVAGYPVRIKQNAIAPNVPNKDLLVTPEHCLFFDNQFIPARMLVNNYSIFYDHSITEYTYYHVETEEHSVIWADGMLTETYLDTGNRNSFKQYDNTAILSTLNTAEKNWESDACAPLATDRPSIELLFNQLLSRAKQIGMDQQTKSVSITNNPDIHLVTDTGEAIYPHSTQKERMVFAIPTNTQSIYLASKSSRPSDTIGAFIDDRRELGVLIGDITLLPPQKSYKVNKHLTNNELQGWHSKESDLYRWTDGHAVINLEVNQEKNTKSNAHNILVVNVVSGGPYLQ